MRRFCLVLGLFFAALLPARGADDLGELGELYRLLLRTQSEVVVNGADMLPLSDHVLQRMGAAIEAHGPGGDWTAEAVSATIGYGLAGGQPHLVALPLRSAKLDPALVALVRGLVAFRRDRRDKARDLFAQVADEAVPPVLRPAVAMMRGSLAMDDAPREAGLHFRRAVQSAPGTLVEEAALRRLMRLEAGAPDGLFRLARQYWQRFPKSPYRHRLGAVLQDALLQQDVEQATVLLDGLMPLMPQGDRFAFLSTLSRRAIFAARSGLARMVLARLRVGERGAQKVAARNTALLNEIARLTSADVEDVAKRLAALDPALLTRENRTLLAASRQIAQTILAPLAHKDSVAESEALEPSAELAPYHERLSEIDGLLDD